MANNDTTHHGYCCSFCGRPQEAVDRLIAGHGAYICNECVELCMSILEPETADRKSVV